VGQVPRQPILSHPQARVVLAPNAFKGTLTAAQAAEAMAVGVRAVLPRVECIEAPIADGGDGSVAAFLAAGFQPRHFTARGPTGEPVEAVWAWRDGTAVVELAGTCGMALLPGGHPAPMTSSTLGLGDVIADALDAGATSLLVCLGGSASTDGGTGLLVALGARLRDDIGLPVAPGGAGLRRIDELDLDGLDPRLGTVEITLAVDVLSPLLGDSGAAHVFAPQKGADAHEVVALAAGLGVWAHVLARTTGRDVASIPGSGAAGGTAAALMAVCGAQPRSGADVIASMTGLDSAIEGADLVVTGEGRFDHQSALGKGCSLVIERAHRLDVPVLLVAGSVDVDALVNLGLSGWAEAGPVGADARRQLEVATAAAVRDWSGG
jgi:glycerate kinase